MFGSLPFGLPSTDFPFFVIVRFCLQMIFSTIFPHFILHFIYTWFCLGREEEKDSDGCRKFNRKCLWGGEGLVKMKIEKVRQRERGWESERDENGTEKYT